ncbi:MAG: hypothetical protein AAF443_05030, partial [Chlamydiota bacterium]
LFSRACEKYGLARISHKALEKFGASVFRISEGVLLEMVTTIPCKISLKSRKTSCLSFLAELVRNTG